MNNIEKQRIIVRQIAERLKEATKLIREFRSSEPLASEAAEKHADILAINNVRTEVAASAFKELADDDQFWNMLKEDYS